MKGLTVVFLTENKLPEKWSSYQNRILLKAIKKNKLITVSRRPMKMGLNVIQKEPRSILNIYKQMLRAFKIAKTEFVAIAEDDTLYHPSHFNNLKLRRNNAFAYNLCNWKLFNWGQPTYHWTSRLVNYTLTAPRMMAIQSLEERFNAGWNEKQLAGELGRPNIDKRLSVSVKPVARVWSVIPIININHDMGFDAYARKHRKRMGLMRAFDVPYWGRADELIKKFND